METMLYESGTRAYKKVYYAGSFSQKTQPHLRSMWNVCQCQWLYE